MISDETERFFGYFSFLTYSEYIWHIQKFKHILQAAVYMGCCKNCKEKEKKIKLVWLPHSPLILFLVAFLPLARAIFTLSLNFSVQNNS